MPGSIKKPVCIKIIYEIFLMGAFPKQIESLKTQDSEIFFCNFIRLGMTFEIETGNTKF